MARLDQSRDAAREAMLLAAVVGVVITGMVGGAFWFIYREIRRRQEAQAELLESHRELEVARLHAKAVLDASSEAMVLAAPDTRFLTVNARHEEFFGISEEQMLGRPFADVADEFLDRFEDPETFVATVSGSARDREKVFTLETRVVYPQRRELLLTSTPVQDEHGNPLARLYAFRDVTAEREADRMKAQFVPWCRMNCAHR